MERPGPLSRIGAAPASPPRPFLLDERSRPDFREVYGGLVEEAARVDVAIRKVRLSGMSLGRKELKGPGRIRVLLAEINVLGLASEAEAMAASGAGRDRLVLLLDLLGRGSLHVRSSPLGGWAPDFSLFHGTDAGTLLLVGPHWFARPYPHRGPALGSIHGGRQAARIGRRYDALWEGAHAVERPVRRVLQETLERVPSPA